MIKKTSLALILCTFLCFTQPNINAATTIITTVHESSFEILYKINPDLAKRIAIGAITGGLFGLISYIIKEIEKNSSNPSSRY